jgi:hypothetical protein
MNPLIQPKKATALGQNVGAVKRQWLVAIGAILCVAHTAAGGQFTTVQLIPAGLNPRSVVVSDFNNDGNLDFAVVNELAGPGTVEVFLGNGRGHFRPAKTFSTNVLYSVVIAADDFNGDGKMDIAVLNNCNGPERCTNGTLSVALGNGDGTFQSMTNYDIGTTPTSLAVGDLNHDGKLDIVVASASSHFVSVFIGLGDGSFASAVNYDTGHHTLPYGVALGDLNGDGNPDIAVADNESLTASVRTLLGNGDGTFRAGGRFATGGRPSAVVVGDFNSDGKLDVAVANQTFLVNELGTAAILLGDGNGRLQPPISYEVGAEPNALMAIDVDGDGKVDLAVVNISSLSILTGSGDGRFRAAVNYTTGAGPVAVAGGDINGDQHVDLLVADSQSDDVSLFLGATGGRFRATRSFATGQGPSRITSADFNNDGKPDVAVTNYYDDTLSVYLGNGSGILTLASAPAAGHNPHSIVSGDFNKDGKQDLAVGDLGAKTVWLLFGRGDGSFHSARTLQTTDFFSHAVAVGDFNGDGNLDLVVAVGDGVGAVDLFLGTGDGTFQPPLAFGVGADPESIAVADFNRDGNLDLAVANFASNSVSVLLGNGAGGFGSAVSYVVGTNPISVATADLNGDDIPDLVCANLTSSSVSELIGTGSGSFQPAIDFVLAAQPAAIVAADFDRDGKIDVAISEIHAGVALAHNDGSGALNDLHLYAAGEPEGLVAADFKLGGDLDLVVVSGGEGGYVGTVSSLLSK